MKSIKKLLSILFVSISSFVLVGVMNVSAQVGFSNSEPVCMPENVKPGEEVTCYLRGNGTHTTVASDAGNGQEDVQGKTHGFVVRLYTTDGLLFDRVEPYINDTNAASLVASAQSQSSNETIKLDGDNDTISFTCTFDSEIKAPKAEWKIEEGDDYRCALFYSKTKTPVITVESAKPNDDIKAKTGEGNGIMVIGKVIAHIDKNLKDSSCGELCVYAREAKDTGSYTMEGSETYFCSEVHYTGDGTPASNVETGAFTSYLLLAVGAAVAIGAVVLAKRNNKFYKV